jgi:hypothetical protein
VIGLRDAEARHGQQEARIDAIIARLDTFSTEHAGCGPFARRLRTISGAYKVEHAADDVAGPRVRDARGFHARTNLNALAASRAGVEHVFDTFAQSRLERDVAHRLPILPANANEINHARPALNVRA